MASTCTGPAWIAILCLLAAGCDSDDPSHLAEVGRRVAAHVEPLVGPVNANLAQHWHEPAPAPDPTVAERVTARLRWEKSLADAVIQVVATDDGIELKGTLKDAEQKKRAVTLAESTTGVERVIESLQVGENTP
jgi:BON domain